MTSKSNVLFVCVHNAGRTQMAAGYLTHLDGDRIKILSAGSTPANSINPVAIQVMWGEGIDISSEQPKNLTYETVQSADVVITKGCGDTCKFYPARDTRVGCLKIQLVKESSPFDRFEVQFESRSRI